MSTFHEALRESTLQEVAPVAGAMIARTAGTALKANARNLFGKSMKFVKKNKVPLAIGGLAGAAAEHKLSGRSRRASK